MSISLKYFVARILTGIIVLFLVVMIFSSILVHVEYNKREVDVRKRIIESGKANSKNLSEMSVQEREEWMEERKEEHKKDMGVDKPAIQVSVEKALTILKGNLGKAERLTAQDGSGSQSVWHIISEAIPRTILLYVTAVSIYIPLGLYLGLRASRRREGILNKLLSSLNVLGTSMPMWWLGMLILLTFGFSLEWFPLSAIPFPATTGVNYYLGVLYRMALPVLTIVLSQFGAIAWTSRRFLLDEMEEDYVMGARAKGFSENDILYKHALKSSAPPLLSKFILTFLNALPAMIITEVIFGWPGIGLLYYKALVVAEDRPVVIGLVFVTALLYVSGYIIADFIQGLLDPRIRVSSDR